MTHILKWLLQYFQNRDGFFKIYFFQKITINDNGTGVIMIIYDQYRYQVAGVTSL